jgi:hypothetical protein
MTVVETQERVRMNQQRAQRNRAKADEVLRRALSLARLLRRRAESDERLADMLEHHVIRKEHDNG